MKVGKLEIGIDGIVWGDWYYFYWWNWLPSECRYIGRENLYYNGPHHSFGFWFFNVSWRMPWTSWDH